MGFPTANLELSKDQALPKEGVYAGAVTLDDVRWPAAISVGRRPQFYDHGDLLVEVYLIGYEGDLYGRTLDVMFLARLRDQTTFSSEAELTEQFSRDVTSTRRLVEDQSKISRKLLR